MRLISHPYAKSEGDTLQGFLVDELSTSRWSRLAVAVAYARESGNSTVLMNALHSFAAQGNTLELTFGANTSASEPGSDYEAIQEILRRLAGTGARIHLYHERGRLFHPKVYLFDNQEEKKALAVIGSSNWTRGGFFDNVELNMAMDLNLRRPDDRATFQELRSVLEQYWQENDTA